MEFLGSRVKLNPRPVQIRDVALEVAMLGHCPGIVRIDRLLSNVNAVREIQRAGYGPRLDVLRSKNIHLYHLPIPCNSLAEFEDIFPEARTKASNYESHLSGSKAWLPKAIDDFFANGGEKLWVVQIPQEEGVSGFLPSFNTPLHDIENLRGISCVQVLTRVGIVALPDLERIQVSQGLPDIEEKRLANPTPQFVPCSSSDPSGPSERRNASEMLTSSTPEKFITILRKILSHMHANRPDMQCLFSLPLEYSDMMGSPTVDHESISTLNDARTTSTAYLLRQVQLLFPYLRSAQYALYSSVGVVAGTLSRSAQTKGVWRSIAAQPMVTDGTPYPIVNQVQKLKLREDPGVGILEVRRGKLMLDDERIVVPALHKNDYNSGALSERNKSLRSGEVVRFMGYLVRQLRELGETLIFNVDYRDPRPRLLLEKFFNKLHEQGALRGARAENAYQIQQSYPQEGVIAVDIQVAPAFPIDKIELTFVNRDGSWLTEANNG